MLIWLGFFYPDGNFSRGFDIAEADVFRLHNCLSTTSSCSAVLWTARCYSPIMWTVDKALCT